jgi:hypothetical protein
MKQTKTQNAVEDDMDNKALYKTAIHTSTGFFCSLMRYDRQGDRFFCNFGTRPNPFTWVPAADLSRFCF